MKKLALLGFLSLFGAPLMAMVAPNYKQLLDEALADATKVQAFTDAVIAHKLDITSRLDIDTEAYDGRNTFTEHLNKTKRANAALTITVDNIFAALAAHRSEPAEVDEFCRLVNEASLDSKNLPALQTFLEGKGRAFNIDLIILNPGSEPDVTVGDKLHGNKNFSPYSKDAQAILKMPLIKQFRYEDTSLKDLWDHFYDTLGDPKHFAEFDTLFTDMETRKVLVDIDRFPGNAWKKIMHTELFEALQKDNKVGALLIAERVQAARTDKNATLIALFKAFKKDPKHGGDLSNWFKKFHVDVDVDNVVYKGTVKLGTKLDELLTSTDDAVKTVAIAFAEVVRPYREADMKTFRDLFAEYKKDKTKLDALKKCFDLKPFDIDIAPLDPAKPQGETLGDAINACKNDALSVIFKDKRSKAPVVTSVFTLRNFVIAFAVTAVSVYLWNKYQSQEQTSREELPVIK